MRSRKDRITGWREMCRAAPAPVAWLRLNDDRNARPPPRALGLIVHNMLFPVAGEIDALAALHCQRRYPAFAPPLRPRSIGLRNEKPHMQRRLHAGPRRAYTLGSAC